MPRSAKQEPQLSAPATTTERRVHDVFAKSPPRLHRLQQTAGNHATVALLRLGQAKLEVGPVDDPYEREADVVSRQVMAALQRTSSAPTETQDPGTGAGDAVTVPGAETTPQIAVIRRRAAPANGATIGAAGGEVDAETEQSIQSARSGGRPLDAPVQSSMEGAFDADFSSVRLHTDSKSADLNDQIQARAFTVGSDIFLGRSAPSLDSGAGKELLAHELTHTVQQGAAAERKVRRRVQSEVQPAVAPRKSIQRDVIQRDDESDAKDLEARDRLANKNFGHALDRHGPGVSDSALKNRLATGVAPDGASVPVASVDAARGISSKFESHKTYLATRKVAGETVKERLDAIADHIAGLVPAYKKALDDYDATPVGPTRGAEAKIVATAKKALVGAAEDSRKPSNGMTWAPVDISTNVEALVRAGGADLNKVCTLRPDYEVVVDHGSPIGYGFEGVSGKNINPDPTNPKSKDIRVFDDAAPTKLDLTKTRTLFSVTGGKSLAEKAYTPATWDVIQHFPVDETPGVRIKGASEAPPKKKP